MQMCTEKYMASAIHTELAEGSNHHEFIPLLQTLLFWNSQALMRQPWEYRLSTQSP